MPARPAGAGLVSSGRACPGPDAACCRAGKIFLPEGQYRAVIRFLDLHGPGGAEGRAAAIAEFTSRCEPHAGFWLYDQEERCQFLEGQDRCGLSGTGVRPVECLWWPLHVYDQDGQLGVHAATWCCTQAAASAGASVAGLVAESAEETGLALIRAFRRVYPGRPGPRLLAIGDQAGAAGTWAGDGGRGPGPVPVNQAGQGR